MTKFGPKRVFKVNNYKNLTKKEERKKNFIILLSNRIRNERVQQKKKEKRGFGTSTSFFFPPFSLGSHHCSFKRLVLVHTWLFWYFEGSNCFGFLKF